MDYSQRLHNVIPGGAHTYSRGDDQFPYNAPQILTHGQGCYAYDPDGNKYLDYGMGLRSVNIGYGNEEIAKATYEEILKGNNLTRPSLTELKAAELLCDLIPSAEMVKFAKHGSVVTTAAVKLARAYTGKDLIAIPFEHPFFSFDDWFIGTTAMSKGVPAEIGKLTVRFHYNDIQSLEKLFSEYPGQISAVMLEAATSIGPKEIDGASSPSGKKKNFLHQVQDLCKKNDALFIIDEMITGFRWDMQGAQKYYDIEPDISTFGKAMANGFAVAALTGRKEIMNIGGIQKNGQERVFLTSTTHGAEMGALGAFIKTMEILKRDDVIAHFWNYGNKLKDGINQIATDLGIQKNFYIEGYGCSPNYIAKDQEGNISLPFRTLFAQEMLSKGVMMPYIALCFSHTKAELQLTLDAAEAALKVYKNALESGIENFLKSKPIKPVFRKFN